MQLIDIRFFALLTLSLTASIAGNAQETADTDDAVSAAADVVDTAREPNLDQVVPVADAVVDQEQATVPEYDPDVSPAEELSQLFQRYKQLLGQGTLDEADAVAKRVTQMTIELTGTRSAETAKALTNLAIVQHLNKDFESAQQNFSQAVDIIEQNEDRLHSQLVNPLTGLGNSQLEGGRPDLAAQTYQRAVHVTHVNDGPHNLDQVDLLESLAESSLRLGDLDGAKQFQDRIYALNLRHADPKSLDIVPALMRRAAWQHRAGFVYDERTSLRTVVRIIEDRKGKEDLALVDPLIKLGRSYFFLDTTGAQTFNDTTISGEVYFKRAVRIAAEQPESDWKLITSASLSLGDYYMYTSNPQRARQVYRTVWNLLSEDESRLDARRQYLEQAVTVKKERIPKYLDSDDDATPADDESIRNGTITVSYDINERGRVSNLQLVEARPAELVEMQRIVQRNLRRRVYRPRFEDASPVKTSGQRLVHNFYYRQSDLDRVKKTAEKTVATAETD